MKKIIILLRWLLVPIGIIIIMIISFALIKLINLYILERNELLVDFIAGGVSFYFSVVAGLEICPNKSKISLNIISVFLLLVLVLSVIYTNFVTMRYYENISLAGHLVGLFIGYKHGRQNI